MEETLLRNRPFDELQVGDTASLVRIVGRDDIDLFAAVSGDVNPAHLDATFAATDLFGHIVAHGMWTGALVSVLLGTKLPAPGTIYLEQGLRFRRPIGPSDTITVTVTVKEKRPEINIQPTLREKRCQNAVDLYWKLGLKEPLVAVLAAVETIDSKMPATLDAAALTVMAARGQITGAKVDGPLAFDNAINPGAARKKGIVSPVAGYADILLVPDLEAGNMLAKQLIYFADATAAGLVLGARVPIVLTSRSDALTTRIASAALAKLLMAPDQPKGLPAP